MKYISGFMLRTLVIVRSSSETPLNMILLSLIIGESYLHFIGRAWTSFKAIRFTGWDLAAYSNLLLLA